MNENSNKVLDLFNKDHWFWGAFHQNWWTYGQVILAAFMINFFSLGSSIFIMTVYDRVIPNNAVESLVALCIGMVLLISFDFLLKFFGHFLKLSNVLFSYALISLILLVKRSIKK